MHLTDIYYQEIIENANYHIAADKRGAVAFSIAMLLISAFSALMIKKIGIGKKDRNKYCIIIICAAIIMSVVFVSYSLKQISNINAGIENKEWVEYSGSVFFDSGKNRLILLDNGSSIPLFSGKDKNGIINNNYVNIPAGYS